jgi:hypothetical protein
MMDLKCWQQLQDDRDKAGRIAERMAGVLDAALVNLKREFGCTSLKDAARLLKELEREEDAAARKFDGALAKFVAEHEEKFRD